MAVKPGGEGQQHGGGEYLPKGDGAACWLNTQTSQAAVPYIGKARPFFRVSIQAPGRGSLASRAGAKARITNGAAKPRARARNTASEITGGWVRAKPRAPAMNLSLIHI